MNDQDTSIRDYVIETYPDLAEHLMSWEGNHYCLHFGSRLIDIMHNDPQQVKKLAYFIMTDDDLLEYIENNIDYIRFRLL